VASFSNEGRGLTVVGVDAAANPVFSHRAADQTFATDILGWRGGWLLSGSTAAGNDLCGASRGRRVQAGFIAVIDESGHLTKEIRMGASAEIDGLARMPDGSLAMIGFEERDSNRSAFGSELLHARPDVRAIGFAAGVSSRFQRCQEIAFPEIVPFVARAPVL
jgi:hypothetical protein